MIVAIISTFIQINIANDTIAYLENNLPNFTFKDNKLTLEDNKAIILDDEILLSFLGNKIVINTLIKKEQAIDQYKDLVTEKNNVLVFLNEEYVLITNNYNIENNNKEGIDTKKYSEISSKYINSTNYEYTKKDVAEYLKMKTTHDIYIGDNRKIDDIIEDNSSGTVVPDNVTVVPNCFALVTGIIPAEIGAFTPKPYNLSLRR